MPEIPSLVIFEKQFLSGQFYSDWQKYFISLMME